LVRWRRRWWLFGPANPLSDGGFASAPVQAPDLIQKQIRFAFTVQVLIACAAMLATRPVAMAFHDATVQPVLVAIAPLFLLQSFWRSAGWASIDSYRNRRPISRVQGEA
jgi:nitrous oxidase accessory protein NosD